MYIISCPCKWHRNTHQFTGYRQFSRTKSGVSRTGANAQGSKPWWFFYECLRNRSVFEYIKRATDSTQKCISSVWIFDNTVIHISFLLELIYDAATIDSALRQTSRKDANAKGNKTMVIILQIFKNWVRTRLNKTSNRLNTNIY